MFIYSLKLIEFMDEVVNYQNYVNQKGTLDQKTVEAVLSHTPSEIDFDEASRLASICLSELPFRPDGFDGNLMRIAAKVIGVVGNKIQKERTGNPSYVWLFTEAYLLAGINPEPFVQACVMSALR